MTNKASIQIPVGTICDLFDDWHGEGSILEIKLEKPVVVPYGRFELRPAHSYKYNVDEVYGLCWDAWKRAA